MLQLKDLNATINSSKNATKFAEHFSTGTSIKNIMKAMNTGHEKIVTKMFDEKFASLIMGNSVLAEALTDLTVTAFSETVKQNEAWIAAGDTKSTGERVTFLVTSLFTQLKAMTPDDKNGLVTALMSLNNDDVKKLCHEFEKDGIDKASLTEFMFNVAMCVGMRAIINAGVKYVAPAATDENGNPITVEVIDQDGTVIISDGAPHTVDDKTGTASQEASTPKNTQDIYALVETELKGGSKSSSDDVMKNIKLLLDEIDGAPADIVNRAGTILMPYTAEFIKGMVMGVDNTTVHDSDNLDFGINLISGILPHNWTAPVDLSPIIKQLANLPVQAKLDPEVSYDSYCTVYVFNLEIIYRLLAMMSTKNPADVVEGFRMVFDLMDIVSTIEQDPDKALDTIKTYIAAKASGLHDLIERVNTVITTKWERTHGMFDAMITGMWKRSAERALNNGLKQFQAA